MRVKKSKSGSKVISLVLVFAMIVSVMSMIGFVNVAAETLGPNILAGAGPNCNFEAGGWGPSSTWAYPMLEETTNPGEGLVSAKVNGWIASKWLNAPKLKDNTTYEFSALFRNPNSAWAQITLIYKDSSSTSNIEKVLGTTWSSTWSSNSLRFTTSSGVISFDGWNFVGLVVGSTGDVWIDDIQLKEVIPDPTPTPLPTEIPTPSPEGVTPEPTPTPTPTPLPTPDAYLLTTRNASFETGTVGQPAVGWDAGVVTISNTEKHTGSQSGFVTSGTYAQIFSTGAVSLKPYTIYKLSVWVKKGAAAGGYMLFKITYNEGGVNVAPQADIGATTSEWTQITKEFSTGANIAMLDPLNWFGIALWTAADVYIDDMALQEMGPAPTPEPTVEPTVEPTSTPVPGYDVTIGCLSAADAMNSGDLDVDAYFNGLTVTNVIVKPSYLSSTILYSGSIDPVTKSVVVPALLDGNYVITLSRGGTLVRDIAVTVSGSSQDLGDKSLMPGDLVVDGGIDVADLGTLLSVFGGTYGDPSYTPVNDFNVDGSVDVADLGQLLAYFGNDITAYGETVDFES